MDVNALLATPTTTTAESAGKGFGDMKPEDFFKILIAQLSNQDPLQPMENAELLNQINSISELSTTTQLNDTLKSFGLSQTLGAASSLIGKNVTGKAGTETVSGIVESALVEDSQVYVVIDGVRVPMTSVTEVSG